ncbi:hypothetical protein MRX96_054711 [Rhipicephalus microplus]
MRVLQFITPEWCTARSTKASVFSVLWALLRKRGIIWLRVWWTKPLSLGIPFACMLLLALCERHFLPDIAWEGSDITYEPEDIFDVSYGFIEKDNARAVVWFNGQCPHSAPISLNLFHTALLRNLTGNKGSRITLVNSPDVRKAEEAKIEFETRYGQLEPLAELLSVIMQDHPTVVSSAALFLWGFVCRWFPTYALVRGIIKVILLSRLNAICLTGGELLGEACRDSQYSMDQRMSRCCDEVVCVDIWEF